MKVATSEIMRKIDKYSIETLAIPGTILMENAALKVIKNIELDKYNSFVVVCGKGNNGGDGFAIARHLVVLGKEVEVFLIGTKENMSVDCEINYNILKNMNVKITKIGNIEDMNEFRDAITETEVTVDAIFGTGLTKNICDVYDLAINIMNENSAYIISVDVPSGFDCNDGRILGNCVRADKTISFQLYKKGFLNYGTDKYTGNIVIEDIGIPQFVIDKFHENEYIVDRDMVKKQIIKRDKYAHKGDYGKILVIAGSDGYTGAAYICTQGAVRSGAGLVSLYCPDNITEILSNKLVEAMTVPFSNKAKLQELLLKSDVIAIGPGLGDNEQTLEILRYVIKNAQCPIVIDADGINVLKDNLDILKEKKSEIILTPHFGEMSRITGISIEEITQNRMEISKEFAKKYGVIVLLKGYNTIITDGDKTIINSTGNSAMASGGMGDCLTGMVASFIGQGYKIMNASCMAAYIHGYCGEKLSKNMFCVNATHVIEEIPYAIKDLQE